MSMVYQSCSASRTVHHHRCSVLRMILICCNHVLNLTDDFRGPFRGPCTLSNQVFRGGHPVFQGGQALSGPLVIRPLLRSINTFQHSSFLSLPLIPLCRFFARYKFVTYLLIGVTRIRRDHPNGGLKHR